MVFINDGSEDYSLLELIKLSEQDDVFYTSILVEASNCTAGGFVKEQ